MARSIAQLLVERAQDVRPGLIFEDQTWTWAEVVAEAGVRAEILRKRGLAGRHFGVFLDNTPEYVFLLFAAALTGSVVVGINHTRRGADLAGDIRHTECVSVFTDATKYELLDGLELGMPVALLDRDTWSSELSVNRGATLPTQLPDGNELFLLIFTSGSTGAPKAVKMTQGRAIEQMAGAAAVYTPGDVLYSTMPMFHANALTGSLFPALSSGASVVLKRRFSASAFLPDVRKFRCTSFNYVGQSLAHILAQPPTAEDSDNALKFCVGAEASPRDRKDFRRRFGCYVVEGYTSSEGGVAINPFRGMPEEALGLPPPIMDVAIVDPESGEERPRAQFGPDRRLMNPSEAIGEIVRRGGAADFEGYFANDAASARRTRRGWIWTGDLGYRDEAGIFYFAGRGNDWLRVDGENFSAGPIEKILGRHRDVVGVAVYAVPDSRVGDRVMAALCLREGSSFDPLDFSLFLSDQPDLGTKWAPHFVRLMSALPMTGTGKIDRQPLRNERWITTDPVWWRSGRPLDYTLLGQTDIDELDAQFDAAGRARLLT